MSLLQRLASLLKKPSMASNDNEKVQTLKMLPSEEQIRPVASSLHKNMEFVKRLFEKDTSLLHGTFSILQGEGQAGIVYLDRMTDKEMINEQIMTRLQDFAYKDLEYRRFFSKPLHELIKDKILSTIEISEIKQMEEAITQILVGNAVLFIDGCDVCFGIKARKFETRSIQQPETESTILGSKESFVEDIELNGVMIRKRLPTPNLRFETLQIGRLSKTKVKLVWLEGIANPQMIEEARTRLKRIDIDYVFGVSLLLDFIEDDVMSIWPQYKLTERPDILCPNITEGRFAILCDGSPFAIVMPNLLLQGLQTYDDYAEKPVVGTFLRFIRYISLILSLLLTPVYLALVAYNHTILPPSLAQQIASGREAVPFPSFLEVLVMSLVIDILREAGIRLPKAVGSAIGILGAVVIGQAAVSAGYVSPALIIVIAVSAITTFAIPNETLSSAIRVANYCLLLCSALFGLFGIIAGLVLILLKVVSLRSYGVPLLYPIAPTEISGWWDIFIRAPYWRLRKRPSLMAHQNLTRLGKTSVKPSPKLGGTIHDDV